VAGATVLAPKATYLTVTLPKAVAAFAPLTVVAHLTTSPPPTPGIYYFVAPVVAPVVGQVVTFTQSGVYTFAPVKATTDATGTARITLVSPPLGPLTVHAYFSGVPTAGLLASTAVAGTTVVAVINQTPIKPQV